MNRLSVNDIILELFSYVLLFCGPRFWQGGWLAQRVGARYEAGMYARRAMRRNATAGQLRYNESEEI